MSFDKNDMKEVVKPIDFDPFAGREIVLVAPTVQPQQEIWLSCIIGGQDANRGYNESVSLLMKGEWNQPGMEKSLEALIQRHEALRAAFSGDGSEICIYKEFPLNLVYEDLSGKTDQEQKEFIRSYAKNDAATPFDLLNGPLFRFAIFTLDIKTHYLTLTAHHIICDGWSVGIMLQDLGKFYSAYSKGLEPHLPEAIRFTRYCEDEWRFAQTPEYAEIENYWLDQYKDKPVQVNLPIDFPRPAIRTYKSQRDDFELDPALIQSLKKLGARTGSSLVSTLLSSFEIFLSRLTGQDDIVLGLPAAGQSATGNYALVGHCVHLLLLRSHPESSGSFLEYLKERKSKIFDDYDHQRFTFGSLLKKLNIARDPSRVPLVPVVFNMDMGLDDGVAFEGLSYELFYNPREFENFELSVNASGSEQRFVLEWSYNSQLFKPSTIKNMMEEFEALIHALVANPEKSIGEIPFLFTQQTRHPDQSGDYPKDKSIGTLFSEQASLTPDKTALVFENHQLTYRQLEERSNQLANFLRNKGVGSTSLVPVSIERSLDLLVGILGVLKAGAAYVPLDPDYPADRIQFMLQDINAKILITSRTIRKKLPGFDKLDMILIDEDWNIISRESASPPKVTANGKSVACIMYTSGSTGIPKGVMIENSGVISLVRGVQYVNLTGNEVILSVGSTSFDATTFEYWAALLNGGELVLCAEQTLLNGYLLKETIERRKVTMMLFTTGFLNQWIDLDIKIFADLKTILTGGEKLSEIHIEKLRNKYPSIEIINAYGPTENTVISLTYRITEKKFSQYVPIGRPLSNRTAYVLNPKQQLCAIGVVGELYVGGAGVARGYLNQPELTVERFLSDPFSTEPGARMYRTGDLARSLPDGNIEYHGRIDDQIKIRGHRIEPAEIEFVLKQNPEVQQAVVVVHEGFDSDKRLVAYVVPEDVFNKEKLVSYLQSKLPSYMVPREFVQMTRIPITGNGKVDKKALPAPGMFSTSDMRKFRAPETIQQELISDIWMNALGLKQLSIDDNFFEIGGHSLIAVKVMRRIEEKTGIRLPITALFEASTVEKLSGLLGQDEKVISWKSLVPIKPEGNKPPLYIVHGSGLTVLVFHSLAMGMDPDQPVYGLQARGLNGKDEPFDNMEDIAGYYVAQVLEQNPTGPYSFAGYSFGGIVAFEMAKQLKALGKEIVLLAIFDTNADHIKNYDSWFKKIGKKIKRQFPKFKFILKSFVKHPGETLKYQFNFVGNKFFNLLVKARLVRIITEKEDVLEHSDKINHFHDIAFKNYRMKPYDGNIDLFRVKERMYFLDDPIYLGWKPYAMEGLEIHGISGDHKTFLLSPHVQGLSKLLQEIINNRNAGKEIKKDFVNPSSVLKAI